MASYTVDDRVKLCLKLSAIEAANRASRTLVNLRPHPKQRKLKEQLESLKLSRSRLLQQLEHAKHPAHRDVLLNGLKAVEKEIEEVNYIPGSSADGP